MHGSRRVFFGIFFIKERKSQMKRKISVILVLAMVFSMIMNLDLHAANIVHSGSFGQNIKWELTDDGVLTISGSGVMQDVISQEPGQGSSNYYYINGKWYGTPWYGYNKSESTNPITSIVIKKGITRIGDRCFYGLSNVESVSLPNDLKEIGEWAFYNLYKLKKIVIPDTVEKVEACAFDNCSELSAVTLPSSLTEISNSLFLGDKKLESIVIPEGVTIIGNSAFYNCKALKTVTIPSSVTKIENSAFYGCNNIEEVIYNGFDEWWENIEIGTNNEWLQLAYIPHNVTENGITYSECGNGKCCVWKISGLSGNIVIPAEVDFNLKTLKVCYITCGYYVTDKEQITGISFPDTIEVIQDFSFLGFTAIKKIELPSTTWRLDRAAFSGCTSLETFSAPGVTKLGPGAFINCTSLTNLTLSPDLTVAEGGAFQNCSSLELTVPQKLTEICERVFYGCTSMRTAEIPAGVKSIGESAFEGCTGITTVTVPESLETIGAGAFKGCESFNELRLYDNLTEIGENAFFDCASLEKAIYFGTEEQWQNVAVQSGNENLLSALVIHLDHVYDDDFDLECNVCGHTRDKIMFNVVFKDYDGSVISNDYYKIGQSIQIPANPTRASDNTYTYTFSGWDKTVSSTCTGDAEYTAVFSKKYINYTVEFKDWDGSTISRKTYHFGDNITVPPVERPADETFTYTFTGWDKPVPATCNGNAVYTAEYDQEYIDYTVTFKNYDGSIIRQNVYNYGDKIAVPSNPSRASDNEFTYTFTGWDKQVPSNCTGNMEFTAQYESKQIDYTVKFKDYDGTVISEKTYHYGDKITVPNDPVREEDDEYIYTFTGWGAEITVCKGNAEYTAEYSAKKQAVLGDINSDEVIDNKDVVSLFRYVSGTATGAKESICDVNYDKTIDNKDVVTLFKYTSENWPHFHLYGDWTIIKEATCTESGKRVRECIYGETDTQTIAAKGHTFGESTILKEATCTEDGELTHTCKICGVTVKEKIAAKGHSFGDWKTVKETTCTEDGSQKHVCSDCGKAETQKISAKGHSYGSWKATKNATCTQSGEQQHTCSVCGKTETQKIPAKGHVSGTAVRENEIPAPCGGTGSYDLVTRCSVCSAELSRQTIRYSSSYSKHTDTPTCQHCGANVRGELIAALKKDLLYDTDNYIVLASTTNFIFALSLTNSGDPALFVLNDDVSTMLILEDTDTIAFLTTTSTNKLIAGDSVKKSNFSSSYQYMPYDDTNISTTTYDGIDLINTLQQIAALDITECIKLLNSYLKNHGYSYTVKALGFSKFTS